MSGSLSRVVRTGARPERHGYTRLPKPGLYYVWKQMRQRCGNPANKDWFNYGGRGIAVCPEWQASFTRFLADIGPPPSPDHTLDRIDVDGPYSPSNCRWATRQEQAKNKRPRATHPTAKGVQ